MPSYLLQASYTSEALATLVKKPQDRTAIVRATVEKLGGSLVGLWGSVGEHEIVLIIDMPDTVSATAFKMAAFAGGALRDGVMTPLFSPEEGLAAMTEAPDTNLRNKVAATRGGENNSCTSG
jgi:uncharacterized protein with GYD domain